MTFADIMQACVRLGIGLAGFYLLLCVLLWTLQEKLIFHPQRLHAEPTHPAAAAVELQRPDAVLRGWTVNADSSGPVIVYFGGNAEEVSNHIPAFAERDATTVLFNYRGFGTSDGKPSEAALVPDAAAIVEWAKERFPNRSLVLFGLSLGSGIATLIAPEVRPDAAILVSPYRSVEHIALATYPIFPIRWMLRHPFRAFTAVEHMPRTLAFASPTDRVIKFAETQAQLRNFGDKAELRTFAVAHGEFLSHQPVWEAVDEFLADMFSAVRPAELQE